MAKAALLINGSFSVKRLREDLEGQLSAALANMEVELRKCNMDEGYVQLHQLPPDEVSLALTKRLFGEASRKHDFYFAERTQRQGARPVLAQVAERERRQ